MDFLKKMFAKFHSHLRGGSQITRVLGIPGGYPGIPKTRQPYLEGIPISLGIWVWGYPKHGDTQITVTAPHLKKGKKSWERGCYPIPDHFLHPSTRLDAKNSYPIPD